MGKYAVVSMSMGAALALMTSAVVEAASCCGGGAASTLLLPKFSQAMVDLAFDFEHYDGFWDGDGEWLADPPGSDLNQYRLNLGYGMRLGPRWQTSVSLPYVWNQNQYTGLTRNTTGIGDAALTLWYESFDNVMCVWRVKRWEDLKPAVYWGATLTLPTGISPYDDVQDNFDITGRGFYRLDGLLVVDKTIYPWTTTLTLSYGAYLQRDINREYGNYVEPYERQLGNRASGSFAVGYTAFTEAMNSITTTVAYSDLWEDEGSIDGVVDPTSGMRKRAIAATVAWASPERDWVARLGWSYALRGDGWGRNFSTTDIITVGVGHVIR
jgi:hypothetical protein